MLYYYVLVDVDIDSVHYNQPDDRRSVKLDSSIMVAICGCTKFKVALHDRTL